MDYRYTMYENKTEDIEKRKQELLYEMLMKHPRMKNHYKYLRDSNLNFKPHLLEIYDEKCVYCGNSLRNIPIDLFEIDHFINVASFKKNDSYANCIDNLFPSCKACNRLKGDFYIKGEYIKILNPNKEISNVFFRDDMYNIKISNKYVDDKTIESFYNTLLLDNEVRRLDYLLLSMKGFASRLDDGEKKCKLLECIDSLSHKRNKLSYQLDNKK